MSEILIGKKNPIWLLIRSKKKNQFIRKKVCIAKHFISCLISRTRLK